MVSTKPTQKVLRATGELDRMASKVASSGSELADLARRLATTGPYKTMTTPKRIRVLFDGAIIADTLGTAGALYVWENDKYPQYYLPMEAFVKPAGYDVDLVPGESITMNNEDGKEIVIAGFLKLTVKRTDAGSRPTPPFASPHRATSSSERTKSSLTAMILFAADLQGPGKQLRNMVKVRFDAVSQWFEEDSPIYVHPRDPFKRVDILASSTRSIRVSVAGTKIAESAVSMHLYETTLPCRFYIPLTAVDISRLTPSTTRTQCPYKGDAAYHSVVVDGVVYEDICWYYTHPTLECTPIVGMVCFYSEHEKVKVEIMGKQGQWEDVS